MKKEILKGGTAIMVLSLLEKNPMYGYEMIKTINERSEGAFAFKEGTLYPLLHRMEQENMLQSYWWGPEGSRQRKYYKITDRGADYLGKKKHEWNLLCTGINRVLAGEGKA